MPLVDSFNISAAILFADHEWLRSSVVRASAQYRRGHGFGSHLGLKHKLILAINT